MQRKPDIEGSSARLRRISIMFSSITLAVVLVLLAIPAHPGAPRAAARSRHRDRRLAPPRPPRPAVQTAVLTMAPGAVGRPVPRSYFGISTEYWGLPLFEDHMTLFERVLALLRARGDGPLVLRVGGDSADRAFWEPADRHIPRWEYRLTPTWLQETGTLVRALGMRLILDLNLVTNSPTHSALWARMAESRLPAGSIAGFEVGNEPDLYSHWYWLASIDALRVPASALPKAISPADYDADFRSYAKALNAFAPRVPVLGPVIANAAAHPSWIARLIASDRHELGMVTGHSYPYSACARSSSPTHATMARVLSENATAGVAARLRPAIGLAHRAGLRFRLTEMNSVTCSGLRGVSNTFATALWAPDALFELLRAGVDGVNLHTRAHALNAPFVLNDRGLETRPLLYGLLTFVRMLGPGARLMPAHLAASPALHLKAWTVHLTGGTLHVLLIDKGRLPVTVRLKVPAGGPAAVQRLLAPSVAATRGVTLAGQHVGADGRWRGKSVTETVRRTRGAYVVSVPAESAALVTIHAGHNRLHGRLRHRRRARSRRR